MNKLLWIFTGLAILCSVPLVADRYGTERTSNRVEFVFDYRDLLEIASYRSKPSEYVRERLLALREAGVRSLAVYESTLRELELAGRVQTLSSAEAAILTGFGVPADEKSTYVLFLNDSSERLIRPMVEDAFGRLGVAVEPWSYRELRGVKLAMPKDVALLQAMDPDPIAMDELQALGFRLVARLSDQRQPFDADRTERLLADLAARGVTRIIFEGEAVSGYADDAATGSLAKMAELMNRHGIGAAAIELARPQRGLNKLAHLTGYNVVRLHSLPANLSGMAPEDLADRFELAVRERNIRIVFLNAEASLDTSLGVRKDTTQNIINSLRGDGGALSRIEARGFELGPAEPFRPAGWVPGPMEKLLKAGVVLGVISLAALTAIRFFPGPGLVVFGLGAGFSAGLWLLSSMLLSQALALVAGIASSTLAVLMAVRYVAARRRERPAGAGTAAAVGDALAGLAFASAISLIGALFIVALLNDISYLYVLQQYRGVSLLHLAPIVLVFAHVLFFDSPPDMAGAAGALDRIRAFLNTKITVLWVLLAGLAGAALLYYYTRTGNAGQVSAAERLFREALQETLGVRPRTKEFLFAHPVFVVGAYLVHRGIHRWGVLCMAAGVIGQLSMVDTFAHLHTPLDISLIRTGLGLGIGAAIGILLIAAWRLMEKGWKRWGTTRRA